MNPYSRIESVVPSVRVDRRRGITGIIAAGTPIGLLLALTYANAVIVLQGPVLRMRSVSNPVIRIK